MNERGVNWVDSNLDEDLREEIYTKLLEDNPGKDRFDIGNLNQRLAELDEEEIGGLIEDSRVKFSVRASRVADSSITDNIYAATDLENIYVRIDDDIDFEDFDYVLARTDSSSRRSRHNISYREPLAYIDLEELSDT